MTGDTKSVETQFIQGLLERGITLSDLQLQQFRSYFELLVHWNERMNLTNITDEQGVYFKHFYDSLSLSFVHPVIDSQNLLDIGPGAGFPSIPLKIVFPHLQITMVETLNKRVRFLNEVIDQLGLKNITALHARIEDLGDQEQFRYSFDLVTARAVSRLSTLLEISIPFLNSSGFFVSLKGPDAENELSLAKRAIGLLHADLIEKSVFELPYDLGKRVVLKFRRSALLPSKYPRKQGLPFNKPL